MEKWIRLELSQVRPKELVPNPTTNPKKYNQARTMQSLT